MLISLRLSIRPALIALVLAAGASAPALSQEQLYDRFGRPIPPSQLYPQPQPQYYPQQPAYEYRQPPAYNPYAPPPRRSRYQQANICATPYGTCELPGPMFIGKGCKCSVPGAGRVNGTAVLQ